MWLSNKQNLHSHNNVSNGYLFDNTLRCNNNHNMWREELYVCESESKRQVNINNHILGKDKSRIAM